MLNAGESGGRRFAEPVEIGHLSRYDRPQPTTNNYDQLLSQWPEAGVMQ